MPTSTNRTVLHMLASSTAPSAYCPGTPRPQKERNVKLVKVMTYDDGVRSSDVDSVIRMIAVGCDAQTCNRNTELTSADEDGLDLL